MRNFDFVSYFLFWLSETCHVEWNVKWNDEEVKVVVFHWSILICLILQVGFGKWKKSWSWTVPEIQAPKTMHQVSRTCMYTYLFLLLIVVVVYFIDNLTCNLYCIIPKVVVFSCFSTSWSFSIIFCISKRENTMNTLSARGKLSTANLEIFCTQKKILRMPSGYS